MQTKKNMVKLIGALDVHKEELTDSLKLAGLKDNPKITGTVKNINLTRNDASSTCQSMDDLIKDLISTQEFKILTLEKQGVKSRSKPGESSPWVGEGFNEGTNVILVKPDKVSADGNLWVNVKSPDSKQTGWALWSALQPKQSPERCP
jgi:hypothetical protein